MNRFKYQVVIIPVSVHLRSSRKNVKPHLKEDFITLCNRFGTSRGKVARVRTQTCNNYNQLFGPVVFNLGKRPLLLVGNACSATCHTMCVEAGQHLLS